MTTVSPTCHDGAITVLYKKNRALCQDPTL